MSLTVSPQPNAASNHSWLDTAFLATAGGVLAGPPGILAGFTLALLTSRNSEAINKFMSNLVHGSSTSVKNEKTAAKSTNALTRYTQDACQLSVQMMDDGYATITFLGENAQQTISELSKKLGGQISNNIQLPIQNLTKLLPSGTKLNGCLLFVFTMQQLLTACDSAHIELRSANSTLAPNGSNASNGTASSDDENGISTAGIVVLAGAVTMIGILAMCGAGGACDRKCSDSPTASNRQGNIQDLELAHTNDQPDNTTDNGIDTSNQMHETANQAND